MDDRIPEVPPVIAPVINNEPRPLWSVMIPTYNCAVFLKKTLESVLAQDPGIETMQIEVVDDGSTDGNIEALVKEIGKGRIAFFQQKINIGSLRNFETCINRSKGKLIHLLHGDDYVEIGFYKEVESLFNNFPEIGAAFTNFSYIGGHGNHLSIINPDVAAKAGIVPDFLYKIAIRQLIQPPAMVVKRSVYEAVGSFFAVHFGEDWEMWVRIAARFPIAYSPARLAFYRVAQNVGISHLYTMSGKNIRDLTKVINIIQSYLPFSKRKRIKRLAKKNYSLYCIKVANGLLSINRRAAMEQAKGAWKMYKSPALVYWIVRFYLMHLFHFKELQQMLQAKNKYNMNIINNN